MSWNAAMRALIESGDEFRAARLEGARDALAGFRPKPVPVLRETRADAAYLIGWNIVNDLRDFGLLREVLAHGAALHILAERKAKP